MIHAPQGMSFSRIRSGLLASVIGSGFHAAAPVPPLPDPPGTDLPEISVLVEAAEGFMADEQWTKAAEAWSRVEAENPGLAEAVYNRGVAEYRSGDLVSAAEAFRTAAELGDADLAAQAMYNEGTARYADAVKRLQADQGYGPTSAGTGETPTGDPVSDAMQRVQSSLDHFRDAIDADATNQDARINAELAHRLLRRLRDIQKQEQEQQQQQEPQQGDQQSPDQSQQGDQQSQDQSRPNDQQSPDPEQQGDQPSQNEPQQSDQQSEDQQPRSESSEGEGREAITEESEPENDGLSREEAERLLQSVRDKERQRRRAQAREESESEDRRPPARKDW